MLEGLACRCRLLSDGRRQIITFLLPGDLCDLHVFLLKSMDHSIGTITPVRLAPIKREAVLNMTRPQNQQLTQPLVTSPADAA